METPESISTETRTQFPIGSLVRLSEKGRKFTPYRWWNRKGKVIGYENRWDVRKGKTFIEYSMTVGASNILLVVWEGRTRRRICRKHRSDFTLLPAKRGNRGVAVGGPEQ